MNTNDIKPLINQLSASTSKQGKIVIKSFLSGLYKADYDQVIAILDKSIYVSKISSDTIDKAVEYTKLFNEAMALSQVLNEEQRKEAELRRERIAKEFKEYCYSTIRKYGIQIE